MQMGSVVATTGGGRTIEAFDDKFFAWFSRQIPVIENYPYAGIDFSIDPEIPVPLGEEWGEMGKFGSIFFLLNICNFYVIFYIYHFFVPDYLTYMCLLCADVGPSWPADYARNMHHPQSGIAPAIPGGPTTTRELPVGEAERVLRRVERNFTSLTRTVPMPEIEDLPPSMQLHVVGAPRTWVWLFRCLENTIDYYNRAHRPWTYLV